MVRFTVDNRNRLIFYGNPVGYVKDDAAVVDEMFRTDELNQYLSRMNLTPRWEDGIFDRLVSGEVTGEEPVQPRKGCRIWQLKKDVDVAMRFIGYEDQVRKFGEPDAGNYTLVFDGDLGTSDLEQIYTICRDAPPPGYQGYRMALSDVVELYDDSGSEFYYCDRVGFQPIQFKQEQDPCIDMTLLAGREITVRHFRRLRRAVGLLRRANDQTHQQKTFEFTGGVFHEEVHQEDHPYRQVCCHLRQDCRSQFHVCRTRLQPPCRLRQCR